MQKDVSKKRKMGNRKRILSFFKSRPQPLAAADAFSFVFSYIFRVFCLLLFCLCLRQPIFSDNQYCLYLNLYPLLFHLFMLADIWGPCLLLKEGCRISNFRTLILFLIFDFELPNGLDFFDLNFEVSKNSIMN